MNYTKILTYLFVSVLAVAVGIGLGMRLSKPASAEPKPASSPSPTTVVAVGDNFTVVSCSDGKGGTLYVLCPEYGQPAAICR